MAKTVFKLPDLGEGLPDAEIVEWHVEEGERVEKDQALVAVETAKAIVEVPSPFAGTVTRRWGETGDVLQVGDPLAEFELEGAAEPEAEQAPPGEPGEQAHERADAG
ncbi:MAG TPA: biotin/lipoyl-containing protein, partial [Arenicellales bacterium]|nr:biotin/lipoyl-containing protein [Arenicellales bacterium]